MTKKFYSDHIVKAADYLVARRSDDAPGAVGGDRWVLAVDHRGT